MPFDVAFSRGEIERKAWSIIFSEQEGNKFDWNLMRFVDPPT